MNIFFLLMSGILFALAFVFWKKQSQRNMGKMSSKSTSLALVRPSSSGSTKSNADKTLSVNSLSRDILHNVPHSIAMQKRILVNLRIVEYKLAELEHFLVTRGLNGAVLNRKSTETLT